jgi:hypothetical protein
MMNPAQMSIQEETPRPANPLETLEGDYAQAVLHVAWDVHKKTRERTLLFGIVELLPAEVPPPVDDGDLEVDLGGKSEHRVHVRHAVVPARQAVSWYLGCRQRQAVVPEADGRLPDWKDEKAERLRLMDLGEEPPWPHLAAVEASDTEMLPFCPQWVECPRVHHLVPLSNFRLDTLWPGSTEGQKAIEGLETLLHFDLSAYPEYWGSVHLLAPNPVFRDYDGRRQPTSAENVEHSLFRFHPRAGKSVATLELTVHEVRPSGRGTTARIRVEKNLIRLSFDHRWSGHRRTVYDPERGMLLMGHYATISRFNISGQISQPMRRLVDVPATKGRPAKQYRVKVEASEATRSGTAEARAPHASDRLRVARDTQRTRKVAEDLRQRWFDDQLEEAEELLQGLLHGASREVMIVDPYFATIELQRFGLAASHNTRVPIHILTSAACLKLQDDLKPGSEKGDILAVQLKHVQDQQHMNPVMIHVMPGKAPDIHDRFLAIDGRVWLLGSSLNAFGSRGTMMVALSDPEPVRDRLLKAWHDAEELETWLEQRRQSRTLSSKEAT